MAFYSADPAMGQTLADLVRALEQEGRQGLGSQISITWLRYRHSLLERESREGSAPEAAGANWRGQQLREPASLVHLIYLVACEAWLQRQLIRDDLELRRAMGDMVQSSRSGHGAGSLIVDLMSGTTSGPSMPPERFTPWRSQRQLVNRWLETLNWPELRGWNACHKTWVDGAYGRELDFQTDDQGKPNLLNTDGTARLLESVIAGQIISPPACHRIRDLLERPTGQLSEEATKENRSSTLIDKGCSQKLRQWGKGSWIGEAGHEAAYLEPEGSSPMLVVVLSEGEGWSRDEGILPEILGRLMTYNAMTSGSSL